MLHADELSDQVEQALLGAILTTGQRELPGLLSEEFFLEKHRLIWQAILDVRDVGQHPGLVAVHHELCRIGRIDEAGGAAALAFAVEAGCLALDVDDYADRVRADATSRALRRLGMELHERGLSEEEVRDRLGRVPQPRSARPFSGDALWQNVQVQWLEPPVLLGLPDVDRRARLLPGDLVVVGGRTSHGKTAVLVSAAMRMLSDGLSVLYLSLETPAEAVWRRAIAARGRVALAALRAGTLTPSEFQIAEEVSADLARRRFVVRDVRALGSKRAERILDAIRAEPADVVMLDHAQEVITEGESRALELGLFFARLKEVALARPCVVFCAAQLSRLTDQSRDLPALAALKECVAEGQEVLLADGRRCAIERIEPGTLILTKAGRSFGSARVVQRFARGQREVLRLRLSAGRHVILTANHPVLTDRGWIQASQLTRGMWVACLGAFRADHDGPTLSVIGASRARLLGYLMGDGFFQRARILGFINSDLAIVADVRRLVRQEFPDITTRVRRLGTSQELLFARLYENGFGRRGGNPMREWLKELGCYGQRDISKRTPDAVFMADDTVVAAYLSGLFLTDGSVSRRGAIRFSTTSLALAEDVAVLLARLGIRTTRGIEEPNRNPKARHDVHTVSVVASSHDRFRETMEFVGRKASRLHQIDLKIGYGCRSADRVPPAFVEQAELWRASRHLTRRKAWGTKNPLCGASRMRLLRSSLAKQEELRLWLESDFHWQQVRSLDAAGRRNVYDLVVSPGSAFLAGGVLVHNSGGTEEKADVVLLLHHWARTGAKRPDDELEVVVAKNRDGETGRCCVRFVMRYALVEPMPPAAAPK